MDTFKKLFYLLFVTLSIVSCSRDYDAPPIPEPTYDGKANTTIAELKELYAGTKSDTPALVEVDYVVKARVTANDESGNIYKQIYIQDETGAINVGIDQNSIYTTLNVGQEIYLNLHGLSIVNYGDELQIGYTGTNANRIPWEIFQAHISLNSWPDESKIKPNVITISGLKNDMVNTLVQLDNIYFVNGGKNIFASDNTTTNEPIKDANGSSLDVRTSSYANFAANKLPSGSGTIVGVLGRYRGSWQLLVRSTGDIIDFGGDIPTPSSPDTPVSNTLFSETFGTGTYPSGSRPKIADFTDFDMKSPVVYSDPSGNSDIRSISGDNGAHVWFPAGRKSDLFISGINTSAGSSLVLSFQVAANLYDADATGDLNAITIKCNGTTLTIPSTPVSNANGDNAKFYTFTFENIPSMENLSLEFSASAEANTFGLRLDNITIAPASK